MVQANRILVSPEEHIDNPKDYADNLDARDYDRRLRGPVDERRELAVDERNGLKTYIASEDRGITTSAGLVRNLFGRSIQLARSYKRSGREDEYFEALRLLGTGCHCLEDYSAHSNYTELALIELGERDVFPHVGRRTQIQLRGARGPVYPCITGTFGGVDFLHSVMGELSDKTIQSETDELEGALSSAEQQSNNNSILQDLFSKLPDGIFGGSNPAGKADELQAHAQAAQMRNLHITPKEPEAFTRQVVEISKQIYPILQWHDELMQNITETIEKIPVLPDLIESLQNQLNIFVFSLMAPLVVPVIKQIRNELRTGSSEIIQSSMEKQHIVFRNDHSTDPTHSMLSKDHFSNVLNEPAGKVASQVLTWAVPQLVACWEDERIDVNRTLNRIINGVFHHPALRQQGEDGAVDGRMFMFQVVEQWWGQKSDYERQELRSQLSREGVEQGRNHMEGVHDTGHGSCGAKPQGMPIMGAVGGATDILGTVLEGITSGGGQSSGGGRPPGPGREASDQIGRFAGEALGGGAIGATVGGILGAAGSSLLGGAFGDDEKDTRSTEGYGRDGSFSQTYTQTGRTQGAHGEQRYGQAEYTQTQMPHGSRQEYSRYEQDVDRRGNTVGYGFEQRTTTSATHGGGYERTEEKRSEHPGGRYETETRTEGYGASGQYYSREKKKHGKHDDDEDDDDDSNNDDDHEKRMRKRAEKERKKREKEEKKHHKKQYGDDDSDEDKKYKRSSGGYGDQMSHGESRLQDHSGSYGREQESYLGRTSAHGRDEEPGSGRMPSGFGQEEQYGSSRIGGYGRQQEYGYGGGYGGREEQSYGGGRQGYGNPNFASGREEYGGSGYGEERTYRETGGYNGGQGEYGRQERTEYGGGDEGYGREDNGEYGERRRYGDSESGGYGSGGYGGGGYGSNY